MAYLTYTLGSLPICKSDCFFSHKPILSTAVLILISGNFVYTVLKDKHFDIIFSDIIFSPSLLLSYQNVLVALSSIYMQSFVTAHTAITLIQYTIISHMDSYSLYYSNNLFLKVSLLGPLPNNKLFVREQIK